MFAAIEITAMMGSFIYGALLGHTDWFTKCVAIVSIVEFVKMFRKQ